MIAAYPSLPSPPKIFLHLVIIMIDLPELSSSLFSSQPCILQYFPPQGFSFYERTAVFVDVVLFLASRPFAHDVSFVSPPHTIYRSYYRSRI